MKMVGILFLVIGSMLLNGCNNPGIREKHSSSNSGTNTSTLLPSNSSNSCVNVSTPCSLICPDGFVLNGRRCERCPEGKEAKNGSCVDCSIGESLKNYKCAPIVCEVNQVLNVSTCICNSRSGTIGMESACRVCSKYHRILENGKCICPPEQKEAGGRCRCSDPSKGFSQNRTCQPCQKIDENGVCGFLMHEQNSSTTTSVVPDSSATTSVPVPESSNFKPLKTRRYCYFHKDHAAVVTLHRANSTVSTVSCSDGWLSDQVINQVSSYNHSDLKAITATQIQLTTIWEVPTLSQETCHDNQTIEQTKASFATKTQQLQECFTEIEKFI